jgi:hypothetical protein
MRHARHGRHGAHGSWGPWLLLAFATAALLLVVLPGDPRGAVPGAGGDDDGLRHLHVLVAMTFAASSAGVVLIRLWRAQLRREAARAQLLGLSHPMVRRPPRVPTNGVS